jgi:hypothetical protein
MDPVILAILPSASPYSQLYFILFEATLREYGSYSLHIRMFQYIRKHHLFALFASYSLQNVRTYSHKNISFDAKKYMSFSHTREYLLQNIRLEAKICKTLSEFHIQANIRLQIFAYKRMFAYKLIFTCKYLHTNKYSLHIASYYQEKALPKIIFGSF